MYMYVQQLDDWWEIMMANLYMAKILLIRRKTRINQSKYMSSCVYLQSFMVSESQNSVIVIIVRLHYNFNGFFT